VPASAVVETTDGDGVWLSGLFWGLFMCVSSATEADRCKRKKIMGRANGFKNQGICPPRREFRIDGVTIIV